MLSRASQIGLNQRKQEAHKRKRRRRRFFSCSINSPLSATCFRFRFVKKIHFQHFLAIKNLLLKRAHLCLFFYSASYIKHFHSRSSHKWLRIRCNLFGIESIFSTQRKGLPLIFVFLQIFSLVTKQLKAKKGSTFNVGGRGGRRETIQLGEISEPHQLV